MPLAAPVVDLASADEDPVFDLSFDVADWATWDYRTTPSSYFNVVDSKSCDAVALDESDDYYSEQYFRVSVDADCLDGLFIRGYGYGSADEDDILANMSLNADGSGMSRYLALPRSIQGGYYTRRLEANDPADYARLFDAASYPCDRVIIGSQYPNSRSMTQIDRERTLKCASDRERSGPGRRSVGYAEDPVNTATGSFTDEVLDLPATAGVFGLDWKRSYDSGGRTGAPAWSFGFSGHRLTDTVGSNTTTFAYDDAGQLTTATPTTGPATTYAYDGAGRRVSESTGTDVKAYGYNPSGDLFDTTLPGGESTFRFADPGGTGSTGFEFDTAQIRYRFYDWDTTSGLAELTALADAGYDSLGAVTAHTTGLTRASSAPWAAAQTAGSIDALASDVHHSTIDSTNTDLATASSYSAWGATTTPATTAPSLGYRGELTIAGNTYLRARDYNAATAQFTTADPLDGVNGTPVRNSPYHYANNNPINLEDASGLRPEDEAFVDPCARGVTSEGTMGVYTGEQLNSLGLLFGFKRFSNDTCYKSTGGGSILSMCIADFIRFSARLANP